jgi:hypothetical protein
MGLKRAQRPDITGVEQPSLFEELPRFYDHYYGKPMAEYWVVYKDIEESEPRQSFEVMAAPQPGEPVIKSDILLGVIGDQDIYVRRYGRRIGTDEVHLVTYTHQSLRPREVRHLLVQAYRFAQERN